MKKLLYILFYILTVQAFSLAQSTAPATAPNNTESLLVTVTAIEGMVQVRTAEDQPWQPAQVGAKLTTGAEFRTGLRSAVRFTVPPDQTITLDRLGTMKVLQAIKEQGKITTDLGLKYGRARYDIQKAGVEHSSAIHSPGSTLAIRGTDVTYEDQAPWVPSATSHEGRAQFRDFKRQMIAFGGTAKADVRSDKTSPAAVAQTNTKIDPRTFFSGRTADEDDILLNLPGQGGLDARALQAIQQLARGGFKGTFIGSPPVAGPLVFDLIWQSVNLNSVTVAPLPTDLELSVTDPQGHTASAKNLMVGKGSSIGVHDGNDPGTSGFGEERVHWDLFFPAGKYKITVRSLSGDSAQTFVLLTLKDQDLGSVGTDPNSPLVLKPGDTFRKTITVTAAQTNPAPSRPATSGKKP